MPDKIKAVPKDPERARKIQERKDRAAQKKEAKRKKELEEAEAEAKLKGEKVQKTLHGTVIKKNTSPIDAPQADPSVPRPVTRTGTRNQINKTLLEEIMESAEEAGYELDRPGRIGYLTWLAINHPQSFASILAKGIPRDLKLTMEEDTLRVLKRAQERHEVVGTALERMRKTKSIAIEAEYTDIEGETRDG